jgi:3-deoxy-D-manno-octulosonic-acid transferase
MAPTLGLSLYLLANRALRAQQPHDPDKPRPEGVLLWLAAETPVEGRACLGLAQAALARGLCDEVLLTGVTVEDPLPARVILTRAPADLPDHVPAFVDHWKPDAVVVLGDILRPVCLSELHAKGIPVLLAAASLPGLPDGKRWYPGLVSALLSEMRGILATHEGAMREFRRFGAPPERVHLSALPEENGHCLPCTEAERSALSQQFGTRPVWLAASVPFPEVIAVLEAHMTALRATHRLLLILVPEDPAEASEIARIATGQYGLEVARRSLDEYPDDPVQVYIADTEGEYGLWYRLAPVCFMGGTLSAAGAPSQRHPFEPAALGSAILHGPFLGPLASAYGRLRAVGATRIVPSGGDLGDTISDLLEPDRAARLAQAAWTLLARSAEASEELLGRIETLLATRQRP